MGQQGLIKAGCYSVFLLFGLVTSVVAEVTIYGKIHVSGDYIDNGDDSDVAIGSNSSRIGFKGSEKIDNNSKVIWKIESDIDVSGERSDLKARNRYLGISHGYGSLIVGYHDTPFKTLGGKAGVFHNTIAERRAILGVVDGKNQFNKRAKNGVMYISPKLAGTEVRLMRSAGEEGGSGDDDGAITSLSVFYKHDNMYAGIAYEDQELLDADGIRVGAGILLGSVKLNIMYETLDSSDNEAFDRDAYGFSVIYGMDKWQLRAQVFKQDENAAKDDTGAMLVGLGAFFKATKNTKFYGVLAGTLNEDNATNPLAGSGHGDKYKPAQAGEDVTGISFGMVTKF